MSKQRSKKSIFSRLLLLIVLGTILVSSIVQAVFYFQVKKMLKGHVRKEIDGVSLECSALLRGAIMQKEEILKTIANIWSTNFYNYDEMHEMLISINKTDPDIIDIFFGATDKTFLDGAGWEADASFDPTVRSWYTKAVENNGLSVSEVYFTKASNSNVISLGYPAYYKKQLLGVLGLDLNFTELSETIEKTKLYNSGFAFLLDRDGDFVVHPEFGLDDTIFEGKAAKYNKLNDALKAEETQIHQFMLDGEDTYFYAKPIPEMDWLLVLQVPLDEVYEELNKLLVLLAILMLAMYALIFVVGLLGMRVIKKPIVNISGILENISEGEGDLTVRVPFKGDNEIGDIAKYFNMTMEKIRNSIKKVGDNTEGMQKLGENLSSNMTETASAVNQISSNIEGVKQQVINQSASVTETSATMEEIIRTIEQLNTSIETQAASVTQSSASIEEMVANIASISEQLSKIGKAIENLHEKSVTGKSRSADAGDFIKQITEKSDELAEAANIIQNIAGQTNLLAMNAAIEAAHAGDAGKGFAVVADEIRKLAEESSTQGKQITGMIKETLLIIENIREAGNVVTKLYEEFYNLTNEISESENQILIAMQEQDRGNKEVLETIKTITEVTSEVKGGSAEMLSGGRAVASEMQKLDELTRMITDNMNEMASGVIQINNAVQEVQEMAHENKNAIDSLNDEVGQFKV